MHHLYAITKVRYRTNRGPMILYSEAPNFNSFKAHPSIGHLKLWLPQQQTAAE